MSATKMSKVSMTPRQNGNIKTIKVERVNDYDIKNVYLEAHGNNAGLIINREDNLSKDSGIPSEMQLEFTCMMHNGSIGESYAENRRLKFWFIDGLQQLDKLDGSYEFFKELINPQDFPKDYASFIKKVMKQLQLDRFSKLKRVDIDFVTLNKQEQDALVPQLQRSGVAEKSTEVVVRENLQARLDEAYPNCLSMDDLVRILATKENMIKVQIDELMASDVIEKVEIEGKQIGFRRKLCYHNEEVKVVKETDQMQKIFKKEKPTVAIITNLLCEKMAVDAMMTDKTTFVKFEGESHVYTIGVIGRNKVISTKVAMVGRELKARISSANTTTRLLGFWFGIGPFGSGLGYGMGAGAFYGGIAGDVNVGGGSLTSDSIHCVRAYPKDQLREVKGTFQDVKHVFIVGVGGSVPHVYEFDKHSRLGDIVVSYPSDNKPVYVFCEKVNFPDEFAKPGTPIAFDLKEFKVRDVSLTSVIDGVLDTYVNNPPDCEWKKYMQAGMDELNLGDIDYNRPPADTDKLKLKVSEGVTFDIKHPEVPNDLEHLYLPNIPAVRLGFIGSGRPVTDNDSLRDRFSKDHFLLAYDSEYDQVLDSVKGNGLHSFVLIRGIADYIDGSFGNQWQPYASLAAAAFMKAVILRLKD